MKANIAFIGSTAHHRCEISHFLLKAVFWHAGLKKKDRHRCTVYTVVHTQTAYHITTSYEI